jgi:hypothetical protein
MRKVLLDRPVAKYVSLRVEDRYLGAASQPDPLGISESLGSPCGAKVDQVGKPDPGRLRRGHTAMAQVCIWKPV